MTNSKRSLLTREICTRDFLQKRKGDLYFNLFGFIGMSMIFGFFLALALGTTSPDEFGRWFGIVILTFPSAITLFKIIRILREMIAMKNGDFSICADKVKGIGKGENIYDYGFRGKIQMLMDDKCRFFRYADFIHFWEHDRFIPTRTVFDIASVDDEVYVVVLNSKKTVPVLVYSALVYECNELV